MNITINDVWELGIVEALNWMSEYKAEKEYEKEQIKNASKF